MKLSATYHPIVFLGEKLKTVFTELNSYSLLYKSANGELCYHLNDGKASFTAEEKILLQKQRNKSLQNWEESIDILSSSTRIKKSQYELDDELALNTLCLSFKSIYDSQFDQIRFKVPENFILKNFDKKLGGLSTTEKAILSKLIYNFLQADYEQIIKEKRILKNISNFSNQTQEEFNQLKEKHEYTTQLFEGALTRLVNSIIKRISIEIDKNILLDKAVIVALVNAQLDLDQLDDMISSAVYTAYNLNFNASEIVLRASHLNMAAVSSSQKIKENKNTFIADKVAQLLDRYEQSAELVVQKGKKVNGKNVASHLNPPITPPAITEMLRKNERKISFLLQEHPKKWKLIRNGLKPLTKLQENLEGNYRATG